MVTAVFLFKFRNKIRHLLACPVFDFNIFNAGKFPIVRDQDHFPILRLRADHEIIGPNWLPLFRKIVPNFAKY